MLTATLCLTSSHFNLRYIVLSCLACNVRQLMWVSCCIEKWPWDWCCLQAGQAWALWTGAHVCGCHDLPGLWHRHPVWLPQRLPSSRGLREVPCRPGTRGTEGRFNMQSAQLYLHLRLRCLVFTHTHTHTLPESQNWQNMHALGVNTFCFPLIIPIFALKLTLCLLPLYSSSVQCCHGWDRTQQRISAERPN